MQSLKGCALRFRLCYIFATFSSCCMSRFPLIIIHEINGRDFSSWFSHQALAAMLSASMLGRVKAVRDPNGSMAPLKTPFAKGWQLMVMLTRGKDWEQMWICSLNWVIHDSSVWDHKNHKPYFLTIHPWLEESTISRQGSTWSFHRSCCSCTHPSGSDCKSGLESR